MIRKGSHIKVYPYARYKGHPEKDVDIKVFEKNKDGVFQDFNQSFQTMDINASVNEKKQTTGWCYIRVKTGLPLKVGDMVTVDELVAVQKKGNAMILYITIDETSPYEVKEDKSEEVVNYGF